MLLADLVPGTPVYIDVHSGEREFTFLTHVYKSDSNDVSVSVPMDEGISDYLKTEDDLYVRVSRNGKSVRWKVGSWVYIRMKETYLIRLSQFGAMENLNQREAFRLPYSKPLTIMWGLNRFFVQTKDISFTGIGFLCEKDMLRGDKIKVIFNHEGVVRFLSAQIVRKVPLIEEKSEQDTWNANQNVTPQFEYGAALIGKEDSMWIDFVLKQQQEMLRRRSGIL